MKPLHLVYSSLSMQIASLIERLTNGRKTEMLMIISAVKGIDLFKIAASWRSLKSIVLCGWIGRGENEHNMTKDYNHRDILDKLGIKAGHALSFENLPLDDSLRQRALERVGRSQATDDEQVDIVLALIGDAIEATGVMQRWRPRLQSTGGIWLLTYKRGKTGYVDQRELIALGPEVGLVDNKNCSVSDEISGLRFVIRKKDRPSTKG